MSQRNKTTTLIASAYEFVSCREGPPEKVGFSANPVCPVQETGAITEDGPAAVDPVTAAVFRSPHKNQGEHVQPNCPGRANTVSLGIQIVSRLFSIFFCIIRVILSA